MQGANVLPVDRATPFTLRAGDFRGETQVINRRSVIARYRVPKNALVELDGSAPFRLQLKARVDLKAPASAASTYTFQLESAGVDAVRSARPAKTPTRKHPDVLVYDAEGNALQVTSYNALANNVTVRRPTEEAFTATAYVTHGNGDVRLVAAIPSGANRQEIELFNDRFTALHETDQANGRTAPRLADGETIILGAQWELQIVAESPLNIAWDDAARHLVSIRGASVPVALLDRSEVNQALMEVLK